MDSSLPVDIKLSGLGDWLSSRRYINADWANKIKEVRKKIADAILDMPEDSRILELLSNSYINYYNCREIVEILKETEKDSKNFLGFYSSQRMKDWKEIVSLYEKSNLHIAEAAQQLNQLVKFDIPALKRDLTAQEKKIADRLEISKVQQKQSEDLKKSYNHELSRRGLKGDNLRLEFFQRTESLDQICDEVIKNVKLVEGARQYYADMRSFILGDDNKLLLPLLHLFNKSNYEATAYEWFHKVKPTTIDRPNFSEFLAKAGNPDAEAEIDFGDGDINLDFGEADVIDFEAHDGITEIIDDDVIIVDSVGSDRVAVGQEALSLVQNETCRGILIAELQELLLFLNSAHIDRERDHPATVILSGFDEAHCDIYITTPQLETWIKHIEKVLDILNNNDNVELFQIRTDPSYVQHLIDQIREPIVKSKRAEECSKIAINDVATLKEKFQQSVVKTKVSITKAAKLEQQLCEDIASKFTKGRPVHLMGGVKSVEAI